MQTIRGCGLVSGMFTTPSSNIQVRATRHNDANLTRGSTVERLVELLNTAQLNRSTANPTKELVQVKEILLKRQPHLLLEFFDSVCEFQVSTITKVRMWVASFVDSVGKSRLNEAKLCSAVLEVLENMIHDSVSSGFDLSMAVFCLFYLDFFVA